MSSWGQRRVSDGSISLARNTKMMGRILFTFLKPRSAKSDSCQTWTRFIETRPMPDCCQ